MRSPHTGFPTTPTPLVLFLLAIRVQFIITSIKAAFM
jgi:hypothetical protein